MLSLSQEQQQDNTEWFSPYGVQWSYRSTHSLSLSLTRHKSHLSSPPATLLPDPQHWTWVRPGLSLSTITWSEGLILFLTHLTPGTSPSSPSPTTNSHRIKVLHYTCLVASHLKLARDSFLPPLSLLVNNEQVVRNGPAANQQLFLGKLLFKQEDRGERSEVRVEFITAPGDYLSR